MTPVPTVDNFIEDVLVLTTVNYYTSCVSITINANNGLLTTRLVLSGFLSSSFSSPH